MFTQVSLGYYEKELDAARAYDAESLRLRGPSGHVNLPESRATVQGRPQAAEAPRGSPARQPSGALRQAAVLTNSQRPSKGVVALDRAVSTPGSLLPGSSASFADTQVALNAC